MAYAGQVWVDNVTPLDAAHMNALDAGVVGAVDVDNVVAAASQLVANKLLAGDAQPAFKILGDGTHSWGPGGATAPDVNLRRGGASILATDSVFQMNWHGQVKGFLDVGQDPVGWGANVGIRFGPALDTNLYRSAAGTLKTDGILQAGSNVELVGTAGAFVSRTRTANGAMLVSRLSGDTNDRLQINADGGMNWGPGNAAGDVSLYRMSAGVLKTDQDMHVGQGLAAYIGQAPQLYIGSLSGAAGVAFGNAMDTTLVRTAARNLTLNGQLHVPTDYGIFMDSSPGSAHSIWISGLLLGVGGVATVALRVDVDGVTYNLPLYK